MFNISNEKIAVKLDKMIKIYKKKKINKTHKLK